MRDPSRPTAFPSISALPRCAFGPSRRSNAYGPGPCRADSPAGKMRLSRSRSADCKDSAKSQGTSTRVPPRCAFEHQTLDGSSPRKLRKRLDCTKTTGAGHGTQVRTRRVPIRHGNARFSQLPARPATTQALSSAMDMRASADAPGIPQRKAAASGTLICCGARAKTAAPKGTAPDAPAGMNPRAHVRPPDGSTAFARPGEMVSLARGHST